MAEALFEVEQGGDRATTAGSEPREPSLVLRVHVQPAAGRASVVGRRGGALHVRVAAPPVGGRANEAAADLVAELFDLKRSQVELVAGERSREKRFRVAGLSPDDAERLLDEAIEQAGRRSGSTGRRRS